MIASVMLYGLLVGLMLSVAGWSTERAMAAEAMPRRWVWATTLSLSLLLPALMLWRAQYSPQQRRAAQVNDVSLTTPKATELDQFWLQEEWNDAAAPVVLPAAAGTHAELGSNTPAAAADSCIDAG
ncbi:MAG: hypothetical protein QM756_29800 [Polyangiaceae bacterium]